MSALEQQTTDSQSLPIPVNRRLLPPEISPPRINKSAGFVHCQGDENIFTAVSALWNGHKVRLDCSKYEVHPDRIIISRSKGKDYPILLCSLWSDYVLGRETVDKIAGFAAYPRPTDAQTFLSAATYALSEGPSSLFPGTIGTLLFSTSIRRRDMSKTVSIHWLQGSVNPKATIPGTDKRVISPGVTRRYFNWDLKLALRAMTYFTELGCSIVCFRGAELKPSQFTRQSLIFAKVANRLGFTAELQPAGTTLRWGKGGRMYLEMRREALEGEKDPLKISA